MPPATIIADLQVRSLTNSGPKPAWFPTPLSAGWKDQRYQYGTGTEGVPECETVSLCRRRCPWADPVVLARGAITPHAVLLAVGASTDMASASPWQTHVRREGERCLNVLP